MTTAKCFRLSATSMRPAWANEAVTHRAISIRQGVFMVTRIEADGTTVTHVEESGVVHTDIARADRGFLNLSGTWTWLT